MSPFKNPLKQLLDWIQRKLYFLWGKEKFQPIIIKNRESFFQPAVSSSSSENDPEKENVYLLAELEEKALLFWQIKKKNFHLNRQQQLVFFIIIFLLATDGLFTDNLLLSILSILIGLLFWFFQNESSKKIDTFGITEDGVFANNSFYDFSQLKSFWIFWNVKENHKEIFFLNNSLIQPELHFPLITEIVTQARELLLKKLPEEKPEEKIIDHLNKNLNF